MSSTDRPAHASGTFELGGTRTVHRLGFGAMRITGEGVWGDPPDRAEAVRVVRRAVELGVDLIDTADSYGPAVSEELIGEALGGTDEVLVATKCGLVRPGPGDWRPVGRPEYLLQQVRLSLRRLRLERIPLIQLHRVDPQVPIEESLGALVELREAGDVDLIGLSEVGPELLARAQAVTPISSVQNRYNVGDREWEPMVDECARQGVAFIPWFPLAVGSLAKPGSAVAEAAERHGVAPSQVALAWLLARSPAILPIPGTGSVAHLEENTAAAGLRLDAGEVQAISDAVGAARS